MWGFFYFDKPDPPFAITKKLTLRAGRKAQKDSVFYIIATVPLRFEKI
jgi:hypothetical protein